MIYVKVNYIKVDIKQACLVYDAHNITNTTGTTWYTANHRKTSKNVNRDDDKLFYQDDKLIGFLPLHCQGRNVEMNTHALIA